MIYPLVMPRQARNPHTHSGRITLYLCNMCATMLPPLTNHLPPLPVRGHVTAAAANANAMITLTTLPTMLPPLSALAQDPLEDRSDRKYALRARRQGSNPPGHAPPTAASKALLATAPERCQRWVSVREFWVH